VVTVTPLPWNTPTEPYFVIHGRTGEPDGEDYEPIARAVLALFEAAVPRIKAEALREAAAGRTPSFAKWLRGHADRIESEAGKQ
jgi:hypothetical protein